MVDMSRPSTATTVLDVTDADFEQVVIEGSMQRPVVVDMWASWCAPCRTLGPILEKVAAERQGAFLLAKLDVDANAVGNALLQAVQSQGIPTVVAFGGGQPVNMFIGAYPEPEVNRFIDSILPSEADVEADEALAEEVAGDLASAEAGYRDALAKDPDNREAAVGLARILVGRGQTEEAKALVEPLLPDRDAERVHGDGAGSRLGLARGRGRDLDGRARRRPRGRWREALEGLLAALRRRPGDRARSRWSTSSPSSARRPARGRVPAKLAARSSDRLGGKRMPDVHDRIRDFWDRDAETYDRSVSHAVSDPLEAAAWRAALRRALPEPPARGARRRRGHGLAEPARRGARVSGDGARPVRGHALEGPREGRRQGARARFVVGSGDGAARWTVRRGHRASLAVDDARPGRSAARVARCDGAGRTPRALRGVWGSRAPAGRAKHAMADMVRRAMGGRRPPPRPLPRRRARVAAARGDAVPVPLVEAVYEAGWTGVRIQRLRDVEWAARGCTSPGRSDGSSICRGTRCRRHRLSRAGPVRPSRPSRSAPARRSSCRGANRRRARTPPRARRSTIGSAPPRR